MKYFHDSENQATQDDSSEDLIYKGYKVVLDSKAKDETLALQASWEPRCSRYWHNIPWRQYAKVGAALRHFSYTVVALHGCMLSEIQAPGSIRALYKDSCIKLSEQVYKILRELANSIRNKRQFSPEALSDNLNEALENLNNDLKSQPQLFLGSIMNAPPQSTVTTHPYKQQKHEEESRISLSTDRSDYSSTLECKSTKDQYSGELSREGHKKVLRPLLSKIATTGLVFSEALPFAAFTSTLVEMVAKLDHVIDAVEELGKLACFREDEIVVNCERPKIVLTDLPSYGLEQ